MIKESLHVQIFTYDYVYCVDIHIIKGKYNMDHQLFIHLVNKRRTFISYNIISTLLP